MTKRSKLLPFTPLPLMLAVASCCPPFCRPPTTNPCPSVITTADRPDQAISERGAMMQTAPGTNFESGYQTRDGRLTSVWAADVIGFAYKMALVGQATQPGPGLEALPMLGGYFVLQYNVPARPCTSRVDWVIHPEVVFPTGYLFAPRQGSGALRVFIWTFTDPAGMFDLSTGRAVTMEYARLKLQDAISRDEARIWMDNMNNPGPVYVSKRFSGNYNVQPNAPSRLFVAAAVDFWLNAGDRACIGCTREFTTLAEAGLFRGLAPGAGARDKGLYGPDLVIQPVR